jgi:hypothetical protein
MVRLIVTGDPRLSPSNESQPLLTCYRRIIVFRTIIVIIIACALITDSDAVFPVITREFLQDNSNYDQNDRSSGRNDHGNDVEKQSKTHLE